MAFHALNLKLSAFSLVHRACQRVIGGDKIQFGSMPGG